MPIWRKVKKTGLYTKDKVGNKTGEKTRIEFHATSWDYYEF